MGITLPQKNIQLITHYNLESVYNAIPHAKLAVVRLSKIAKLVKMVILQMVLYADLIVQKVNFGINLFQYVKIATLAVEHAQRMMLMVAMIVFRIISLILVRIFVIILNTIQNVNLVVLLQIRFVVEHQLHINYVLIMDGYR